MEAYINHPTPTQGAMTASQKNTLIQHCFFLWSHILVLVLTAIPVISLLVSKLFNTPEWSVPKTYELKIYALAIIVCTLIPFAARYMPRLFLHEHLRYRRYILLFYPCAVLFYSLPLPDFIRYFCVLTLAVIGAAILIYDMSHAAFVKNAYWDRHYNGLLIASVVLSVALIVCESDANTFKLFSVWSLGLFAAIILLLRTASLKNNYFVFFVPVFLALVVYGSMQGAIEVTHYSFFLGPVIEILYGHVHPLNIDIQYGGGLTTFLALYFKARGLVSYEGLQDLLKCLAFIQYLLIYLIANSLYRSQKVAFLTLLAILFFNFFAPNIDYYFCAPSVGFLRFGLIYLILILYSLEYKKLSATTVNIMVSVIGSIAVLWSFESAIYTLPAILFAEYVEKNLRNFLPIFVACFCIIVLTYLSPFFMQGNLPPLWRYNEYAMVYANGFGQIPMNKLTSFWWLFPLLYGYSLIKIITGSVSNKIISALTVYGIAIFTYFAGRSHPISIYVVSIPFILLSVYYILNLKLLPEFGKQVLLALTLIVFSSTCYVLDGSRTVVQGVWAVNFPLMKNYLRDGTRASFLISDSGSPWLNTTSNNHVEKGCSVYSPLKKYIENNSIAILSTDDKNLIGFYDCTKSHNALSLNPYYETALNPRAVARIVKNAGVLSNHYLLVEANLMKNKKDLWGSEMTSAVLQKLQAKKIGELILDGDAIDIFRLK